MRELLKNKWIIAGVALILVLFLVLAGLLITEKDDNNYLILSDAEALILGENKNAETLRKLHELLEKEPVLKELPLTVEYYSDDYSEYTKYILSYGLDDSDRGFYLIMKDYTNVGMIGAISKLTEMGMNTVGVELQYENLSNDSLGGHAE